MSGEPGFDELGIPLDDGASPAGDPTHTPPGGTGPWFVRFAGRRSGPFDADRLRTLARRGALTRMHSLSTDGRAWVPATEVRAVFNADGSVVAAGAPVQVAEDDRDPWDGELPAGEALELPLASLPRRIIGSAYVRPAVLCALALATVMLAMPTSRDEGLELAWWWSEGAIAMTVRGMGAAAVLAMWVIAFLAPEPARAASVAAAAAVLAGAEALPIATSAPWALVTGLLVPVAALLVALDAVGSSSVRMVGGVAIGASAVLGLSGAGLAAWKFSGWSVASAALGLAGAGALGYAGSVALRPAGSGGDRIFWWSVVAAILGMATLFAAAFAGLSGPLPMQGANAAVCACLVLAFSAVSWAAVHEASDSAHLLPTAGPSPGGTA